MVQFKILIIIHYKRESMSLKVKMVENAMLKVRMVENEMLKVKMIKNEMLKVKMIENEMLKVKMVGNEMLCPYRLPPITCISVSLRLTSLRGDFDYPHMIGSALTFSK